MNKNNSFAFQKFALIGFILIFFLVNISRIFLNQFVFQWVGDIYNFFCALVVFIFGIILSKKINLEFIEEKKFFLFLFWAFLFRLLGEVFWAYYELIQGITPVISLADLMWYISYFFVIWALGYRIKKIFILEKRRNVIISLSISVIVSILFLLLFYSKNVFSFDSFVLNFYVVMNICIVALFSIIIYPLLRAYNRSFRSYLFYALGFCFFAIYDFLLTAKILVGEYLGGNIIDIFYHLGYVLIFIGLYCKYKFIHK